MGKQIKTLLQIFIEVFVVFAVLVIIQSQVITLTKVYQWSMYDTLSEGDLLLTEKISYRFIEPKRGDVIILLAKREIGIGGTKIGILIEDYRRELAGKESRTRYVKRLIGLPGDAVTISNGAVYINGEKLEEDYTRGETKLRKLAETIIVPEGYVFVLGDNREKSLDSRYFGCMPIRNIESKVVWRISPHPGAIRR